MTAKNVTRRHFLELKLAIQARRLPSQTPSPGSTIHPKKYQEFQAPQKNI